MADARLAAVRRHLRSPDLRPSATAAPAPTPLESSVATDTYGNRWALTADRRGVLVASSRLPPLTHREDAPFASVDAPRDTTFVGVVPDEAGFIWLADAERLWVMSPRAAGSGPTDAGVGHSGTPTATAGDPEWTLCPSSDEFVSLLPLVGLQRSEADAPAVVLLGSVLNLELIVDVDGTPWLAPALGAAGAPHWSQVQRLPCGNHDLFAAELDGDLFLSGVICTPHFWGLEPEPAPAPVCLLR